MGLRAKQKIDLPKMPRQHWVGGAGPNVVAGHLAVKIVLEIRICDGEPMADKQLKQETPVGICAGLRRRLSKNEVAYVIRFARTSPVYPRVEVPQQISPAVSWSSRKYRTQFLIELSAVLGRLSAVRCVDTEDWDLPSPDADFQKSNS